MKKIILILIIVGLLNNVSAFFETSHNFNEIQRFSGRINSRTNTDVLSVSECSMDFYDEPEIYCLNPSRGSLYRIAYSSSLHDFSYLTYTVGYYPNTIMIGEHNVLLIGNDNKIRYYTKTMSYRGYIELGLPIEQCVMGKSGLYCLCQNSSNDKYYIYYYLSGLDTLTYQSYVTIDTINSCNSVIKFKDNYVLFGKCGSSSSTLKYYTSTLSYVKDYSFSDSEIEQISGWGNYDYDDMYIISSNKKVEKIRDNIYIGITDHNTIGVGSDVNSYYFDSAVSRIYRCDADMNYLSYCSASGYTRSSPKTLSAGLWHYSSSEEYYIIGDTLIDNNCYEIGYMSYNPHICIETSDIDYYVCYEEDNLIAVEHIYYYYTTPTTTTTVPTTTTTIATTTTVSTTTTTVSTSTTISNATHYIIDEIHYPTTTLSQEQLDKINETLQLKEEVFEKGNESINTAVSNVVKVQPHIFNMLSLGTSQQREDIKELILMFFNVIYIIIVLVFLTCLMALWKQK